MFCAQCGKEMKDNDRFCPSCGNEVIVEAVQTSEENEAPVDNESNAPDVMKKTYAKFFGCNY